MILHFRLYCENTHKTGHTWTIGFFPGMTPSTCVFISLRAFQSHRHVFCTVNVLTTLSTNNFTIIVASHPQKVTDKNTSSIKIHCPRTTLIRIKRSKQSDCLKMLLLCRATGEPLGSDPTNRPDKRSLLHFRLQSSTSTCSSYLSDLVFFKEQHRTCLQINTADHKTEKSRVVRHWPSWAVW